jgi:hypothetical protein
MGYIDDAGLQRLIDQGGSLSYNDYLRGLLSETLSPTFIEAAGQ